MKIIVVNNLTVVQIQKQNSSKDLSECIQQMEKYELILLSSQCGELHLARLLSHLFSNQYLYVNKEFRTLIEQDRKGFVPAEKVLMHNVIQQYFQEIGLPHPQQQLLFLKITINSLCPHLRYSDGRIRRLHLWHPSEVKPIGLSGIRERLSISDIRDYFGDDSFAPEEWFPVHSSDYSLIYGQGAREKAENLTNLQMPFKTSSYRQMVESKARNSRINFNSYEKVYRVCQNPSSSRLNKKFSIAALRKERLHQKLMANPSLRARAAQLQQAMLNNEPMDAQQHEREMQIEEERFNCVVKQANAGFNELLRGFARAICG